MNPLVEIYHFEGIEQPVSFLRLDLPDPVAGGNKFFKLKYNFEEMKQKGQKRLLTFGGAYSNFIAAVAFAGNKNGIETVGIIRGNELNENSNDVLRFASANGMQLHFITRVDYDRRYETEFQNELAGNFSADVVLPEGGSNELAVKGCAEILSEETEFADMIFCPVGTGATLAGIISSAKRHQTVIGVAVLNGKEYLETEVKKFLDGKHAEVKWTIDHDHTFGGYANSDPLLENFIRKVKKENGIPLDHVYSGKCFYAMMEKIKGAPFREKKLLFVHTGGHAFMKEE